VDQGDPEGGVYDCHDELLAAKAYIRILRKAMMLPGGVCSLYHPGNYQPSHPPLRTLVGRCVDI
jgi:cell division FtsZ-interacting protein ZapD